MTIDRFNPTTFKLIFPKIPTLTTIRGSQQFFIHVFGIVLPSFTIEPDEKYWQGNKAYGGPVGATYGD